MRPGTDGALALGLAAVMIAEGRYDRDFIRDWSNGAFLVRADTGRLLTAADLSAVGNAGHHVAWDPAPRGGRGDARPPREYIEPIGLTRPSSTEPCGA